MGSGLLGNPLKLLEVSSDLAPNLTVDSGMTTSDLVSLGESLHGLAAKDVQFVTAPVTTWPPDPDEVEFAQPAADAMFAAIARDTSIPASAATASPSASASAPALDVTPSAAPESTGKRAVARPSGATPACGGVDPDEPVATCHPDEGPGPDGVALALLAVTQSLPSGVESLAADNNATFTEVAGPAAATPLPSWARTVPLTG